MAMLLAPLVLAAATPQLTETVVLPEPFQGFDFYVPDIAYARPIDPTQIELVEVPPAVPPEFSAMLDSAIAGGNDGEIDTVVKYAGRRAPWAQDAMKKRVNAWRTDRRLRHEAMVEAAGVFELWKGKATVGGWLTTGNTDNIGLSAVVDVTREGLQWRHKVRLQADFQRSNDITTREHYLASYEPNYKIDDRSYVYGALQYEGDHFLGYDNRYSASVGAGYSVLTGPVTKLSLELGPAYRATEFTDGTNERSLAGRGSLDFAWQFTHAISLTQNASIYWQSYNSTVSGTTALNAKLFGPLSAQLSYNVQYESEPPTGNVTTDTTSRASIIYAF
ncbi:putative salt-induced outer membrane protein [Hephaestia caeni]|uniref:Putative salt-induced outer membrane protein n=1 Tax=Hephaestia caeni TaxID=645617 RepID=A0A397PAT3_9SPHN|nr:DUF481 domain-containing protein [Hephaestia caeni]RIA46660.1 putative salt-induced outer membrane protein [Hephaestia caeni]